MKRREHSIISFFTHPHPPPVIKILKSDSLQMGDLAIKRLTKVLQRSKISDFSLVTNALSSGLIKNYFRGCTNELIFTTNGSKNKNRVPQTYF